MHFFLCKIKLISINKINLFKLHRKKYSIIKLLYSFKQARQQRKCELCRLCWTKKDEVSKNCFFFVPQVCFSTSFFCTSYQLLFRSKTSNNSETHNKVSFEEGSMSAKSTPEQSRSTRIKRRRTTELESLRKANGYNTEEVNILLFKNFYDGLLFCVRYCVWIKSCVLRRN